LNFTGTGLRCSSAKLTGVFAFLRDAGDFVLYASGAVGGMEVFDLGLDALNDVRALEALERAVAYWQTVWPCITSS